MRPLHGTLACMHPCSILRLSAVGALAALLIASRADARDCAYWSANGPSVYNMQNGLDDNYAQHVLQAGIGGLRMGFRIDTQTDWNDALFAQYDAYMLQARAHGLEIMGIVLYESTTLGQHDWNDDPNNDGWNNYVTVFVDTVKQLMDRYGDQIKYWEIWNEPSCWSNSNYQTDPQNAGCYYILPRVYSRLLAEVFAQGQSVITSKGLHLVSGGLFAHDIGGGFQPAVDYMTEVYDLGPWDWMQTNYGRRYPWDKFGYHIYIDQGSATSAAHIAQYLDAIEGLKNQRGDSAPIWMTEFGWSSQSNVSEDQQASNLDIALNLFESRSEVERTFMFKVDDYDGWGLFRGDWSPKPAVAMVAQHTAGCTHQPIVGPDAGPDATVDEAGTDAPQDGVSPQDAQGSDDAHQTDGAAGHFSPPDGAAGHVNPADATADRGDGAPVGDGATEAGGLHPGAGESADDSGCGCRFSGERGRSAWLMLCVALGALARRRKRTARLSECRTSVAPPRP